MRIARRQGTVIMHSKAQLLTQHAPKVPFHRRSRTEHSQNRLNSLIWGNGGLLLTVSDKNMPLQVSTSTHFSSPTCRHDRPNSLQLPFTGVAMLWVKQTYFCLESLQRIQYHVSAARKVKGACTSSLTNAVGYGLVSDMYWWYFSALLVSLPAKMLELAALVFPRGVPIWRALWKYMTSIHSDFRARQAAALDRVHILVAILWSVCCCWDLFHLNRWFSSSSLLFVAKDSFYYLANMGINTVIQDS